MQPGIMELDLHGKNTYQARVAIDAALRRCGGGVYRLRLIHGYHSGTALRDLCREYAGHPRVLRLVTGSGSTELVLRGPGGDIGSGTHRSGAAGILGEKAG